MTPQVDTIWNFWPLPFFVWTIIRLPLNFLFGIIYTVTFIPQSLWNLMPEQIGIWVTNFFVYGFLLIAGIFGFCITFFTFGLGFIPAVIFNFVEWVIAGFFIFIESQVYTIPSQLFAWFLWFAVWIGGSVGLIFATNPPAYKGN